MNATALRNRMKVNVCIRTHFGSVILKISLQRRPMKVADSSTGGYLGMGMCVDW